MAKPKVNVIVEVLPAKIIRVWVSAPERVAPEIQAIEGTARVYVYPDGVIHVSVDPRYDIEEVPSEIRVLLDSEVPDIFREE